jgi:nucleotidyltransferase/DNA polymerase involved in DNA repair
MDAFYAAVEQRDRPELRGLPVIVGADPQGGRGRGVVATASYEARRFGVSSAMPISRAYALCPHGVYVPPDMDKYLEVSRQVMAVLRRVTDLVEPISIDEAFLDVTGSRRAFGTGEEIARHLKAAISEETRLTASVGVAASKLVAKIASDLRKPDGLVVVPPGQEAAFLAPLPVRRLWGVGPKMEEQLARLGIATIGDLARLPPERLERRLGTHGHDLLRLARGEDGREVIGAAEDAKSVGHEHTFDGDTSDLKRLRTLLLALSDQVAARLRRHGWRGRTITLKYRDDTFRTLTRARTLDEPTDAGNVIFETAWALFERAHGARKVRLVGVSVSHFGPALRARSGAPQPELFEKTAAAPSAADRVRDDVARRFGSQAITRASLLGRRERRTPSDRLPD